MKINKYEADYIEQLYNRLEVEEEENYFNTPEDEVILEATYEHQLMERLEEEEYDRFLLSRYNIDRY